MLLLLAAAAHLGVGRCPCVLIDVGLNNGSSLLEWARLAAVHRELPAGSQARLAQCALSVDTCYYGFEANPIFDERLRTLERRLQDEGVRVKLFTSTAFNTHGRQAEFLVERSSRQSTEGEAVGSTLEPSKKLVFIDKAGLWRHNNRTVSSRYRRAMVRSADAAAFFAAVLAADTGFVAAKIDIEGFEYELLRHVLLTQPRVLCSLGVLAVEWHENMVPKHAGATDKLAWLLEAPGCNVSLLPWK